MMLPEWILELTHFNNNGELRFYCPSEMKADIMKRLHDILGKVEFKELWLYPAQTTDDGFVIKCEVTDTSSETDFDDDADDSFDDEEDYFDDQSSFGLNAYDECILLNKALNKFKQDYSIIRYEGYVAWRSYDENGGEYLQFDFSSEDDSDRIAISVVGEALQHADNLILNTLNIDTQLEYFGSSNGFILFLYVYRKWLSDHAMKALIDTLKSQLDQGKVAYGESVDVVNDNLNCFIHAMNSGEPFIMIDDSDRLPDGYADALNRFS